LKHPHIVLLFGLFQTEPSAFPLLVVEKLDTSLQDLFKDCLENGRQLSLQQKVSILLQVASGLAYLHQLDPPAVHGNLTASNILIGISSLTAKITDFGLARAIGSGGRPSLLYSPPEVLEMSTDCEESPPVETDVFFYGVLIIHTINHRLLKLLPSRMKHASKKEMVALTEFERRQKDFTSFSQVEILHFEGLIKACLEFFPEDRPNSLALVSNLQEIQAKVGLCQPSRRLFEKMDNNQMPETKIGIGRLELEISEKEKQLKDLSKDLISKEFNLKETEQKLVEVNKAMLSLARRREVHRMSGKVVQVKHLKRQHQVHFKKLQVASLLSKNVIEFDSSLFFAVDLKSEGKQGNSHLVKITLDDKDPSGFSCEILPSPPGLTDMRECILVLCQDNIHVLGGYINKFRQNQKVFSFSLSENQWKQYLPPLPEESRVISAVSYREHIFVITNPGYIAVGYHRRIIDSLMISVNSPNPAWVSIFPIPYLPISEVTSRTYSQEETKSESSIVIFGDILVLLDDTLYFTNLSDLLSTYAKDVSCSSLTAEWGTLPPPPRSVLSPFFLVAPNNQLLAVHNIDYDVDKRSVFALNTSTFKWVEIANDIKEKIMMSTSSSGNTLFVVHSKDSMYYYTCQ
jgi:serine/threonine protein kinase